MPPGNQKGIARFVFPGTLILLGVVIVLVILMAVLLSQRNQQPTLPVATQDVHGTLAAIVNLTSAAQVTSAAGHCHGHH